MTAFRQVSKDRFGTEKDELLITCFCGAEEYVRFAVLDKRDVKEEYIELGVDHRGDEHYPTLLWVSFSRFPATWKSWRWRLRDMWSNLREQRYSLSDTVLIDEEAARALRDWIDEMLADDLSNA